MLCCHLQKFKTVPLRACRELRRVVDEGKEEWLLLVHDKGDLTFGEPAASFGEILNATPPALVVALLVTLVIPVAIACQAPVTVTVPVAVLIATRCQTSSSPSPSPLAPLIRLLPYRGTLATKLSRTCRFCTSACIHSTSRFWSWAPWWRRSRRRAR